MAHARSTIRAEVVAALTGLATTGGNVFNAHVYSLDNSQLPALVVDTLEDERSDNGTLDDDQMRELTLTVDVYAKSTAPADTIDTIDTEIAIAIYGATLSGVKQIDWLSFTVEREGSEERPMSHATITYQVVYNVDATSPATALS